MALVLDLGRSREFGGLTLDWSDAAYASRYGVALSDDGRTWRDVRQVTQGNGGRDWLALPESEARYVRLLLEQAPRNEFALAEATVQPLAFAATPNDFVKSIAKASPKGWFPRGFDGQQPYWTIVGIDGGEEQGLIGEDGAIEVAKGGFSIEPFVVTDGKLVTWADVQATQIAAGRLSADSERGLEARELRAPHHRLRPRDAQAVAVARALSPEQHVNLVARLHAGARTTPVAGQPAEPVPQYRGRRQPDPDLGLREGRGLGRWQAARVRATGAGRDLRGFVRCRHGGLAPARRIHPVVAACRGCTGPGIGRNAVSHASAGRRIARRRPTHPDDRRCRCCRQGVGCGSIAASRGRGLARQARSRPHQGAGAGQGAGRHAAYRDRAHADLAHRPAPAAGYALVCTLVDSRRRDDLRRPAAHGPRGRGARLRRVLRALPVRRRHGAVLRRRPRQRSGARERQPWRADLQYRRAVPLHGRPCVPGDDVAARARRLSTTWKNCA